MATLKHSFAFDRCRRRGIDAVREELLEKAIAYNFCRLDREGRRQAEETDRQRRQRRSA